MCSKKFLDQCQSAITEIPAGERFALQLDGLKDDKETYILLPDANHRSRRTMLYHKHDTTSRLRFSIGVKWK